MMSKNRSTHIDACLRTFIKLPFQKKLYNEVQKLSHLIIQARKKLNKSKADIDLKAGLISSFFLQGHSKTIILLL